MEQIYLGEITFGTNLGLTDLIKNQKSDSSVPSGNDEIYTGSGMDFVDGQNGKDRVYVEFMGDSTTSYVNVVDTGDTLGDELIIEGTSNSDHILVRSSNSGLGFVALLPEIPVGEIANTKVGEIANTNIERVNF